MPKLFGGTVTLVLAVITWFLGLFLIQRLMSPLIPENLSDRSEAVLLLFTFIISSVGACLAALAVWKFIVQSLDGYDASVAGYGVAGAMLVGGVGFSLGYCALMIIFPSNFGLGPVLGFATGPMSAVAGAIAGSRYGRHKIRARIR